jgi:dephospho-CoA kinase
MGRWKDRYVIGLTGNIGMGKSVVRKMLEHLGAYTIDADGLAHQTMVPGAPAYHPIVDTFGKWILDPDGKINRSKLGAVAFAHPEALTRLEAVTHPFVGQGIDTLINRAKQQIIVVEAIKLIEGQLGGQVDTIWVVDTALQIQLQRLVEKRGMSEVEARKRIEGQNSQRDKLGRANVVISNNGTLPDVWVQVEREWKKLLGSRGIKESADDDVVGRVEIKQQPVPPQPVAQPAQPVNVAPAPAPQPPKAPTPAVTGQIAGQATQPKPPSGLNNTPARPPTQNVPPAPAATSGIKPITGRMATPQPAQPVPPPAPPPVQPPAANANFGSITIRKGMPKTAEHIASLINSMTGKRLTRENIMNIFGEKSYLLAELGGRFVGLAGFHVENLITRVDELLIIPEAPVAAIAEALIDAVEDGSKALQSEVGFVYLPVSGSATVVQAFKSKTYQQMQLDDIIVPAWREAAADSQPPNTIIMAKRLRADRVLKPL